MSGPAPSPYSIDKLAWHPQVLQKLRDGRHQAPVVVHFMPMLACNQSCMFCAYGHRKPDDGPAMRDWKNMELMSDARMPRDKALEVIACLQALGVKAIEITGGGEPLIYPHIDDVFGALAETSLDVGLVTNGTAFTSERMHRFLATKWKWVRVSVDAGTLEDYVKVRRAPESHWAKAWAAVDSLAQRSCGDQRVGVGFVVDRYNYTTLYDCAQKAHDLGAHNLRVSMAFTPELEARLTRPQIDRVLQELADIRADFCDEQFQLADLFTERLENLRAPYQDYKHCAVKDILCVIGGDQRVYTCCTLAFNKLGLIGDITEQTFADLWWSQPVIDMLRAHDARQVCQVECLYEARNKAIHALMDGHKPTGERPLHTNFI